MCSEERPCIPCYTNIGVCDDKLQDFLREATELSYKYGLKFCAQASLEVIRVCEISEGERKDKNQYIEVINGSMLVDF